MTLPPTSRMRHLAPLALVLIGAVIAVAAYMQAINAPFVSDDEFYITRNTKLLGLHLADLWRLFVEPYNPYEFLPLRDLSYWADIALFGLTPSAFRMHNIFLYLLCLPLVYATTLDIWRYFRPSNATDAPWAAAAVAALFALQPAHVEAVVWISGHKDLLSAMFSLLAIWLAVRARREDGISARYAGAALAALLAAMLSKATVVMVAPIIAMLWVIFWRDIPPTSRRYSLLLWPAASLLLAAGFAVIFSASSGVKAPPFFGVEAITRAFAVLGWLARLAVSPESRHFFYPVFEDTHLYLMATAGVAVMAAAVAGMVMAIRRRSLEWFAVAVFFLLCVPYTQLIPFGTHTLVADRWLMLAGWPVVLLIVALCWRLNAAPRAVLLLVVALPWCYQTVTRPHDWRSLEAIIEADVRAYPGHYLPLFQKITWVQLRDWLYRDAGETAGNISAVEARNITMGMIRATYAVRIKAERSGTPDEAMEYLKNLELLVKQPPAQAKWNLPMLYVWDYCQNILSLQWGHLVEQFPHDVRVRYNAGLSLLNVKKYEGAVVNLRAAIESQQLPYAMRGKAYMNLGLALLNSGHAAEAEAPLRAALDQPQPDTQVYCALSSVYKQTKRSEEAAGAEAECRSQTPGEGRGQ